MVLAHTATAFRHHFHSWIIKNIDLETVSHFGIPNLKKSVKCVQSGSQGPQKYTLKSKWTPFPQGACWVSLWTPGSPKSSLRVPKWSLKVYKIIVFGINSDPFQQSTCQQLPADKAPAAGAKPQDIQKQNLEMDS